MGDDPLSSDHLPITINITGAVVRERNAPHETFNYNKADWLSFQAELGALPISDHGSLSIEALNSSLSEKYPWVSILATKKGSTLGGAMPVGRRSKTKDIITKSIGGIAHR